MNAPVFSKYLISTVWLVCLLCMVTTAKAALMEDLYVGEAPVDEVGLVNVQAQLRALDEVLFRLTGVENARDQLALTERDLPTLIQSRQIVERRWVDGSGQLQREIRERVEFDPMAIDELLSSNALPRWGRERASILVWAVIQETLQATLLDDPYVEQQMSEMGRRYGLDLVRPLADALDLSEISIADIRGGFLEQLGAGLTRYGASVGLMLDFRTDGDQWLLRAFWRIDGLDGGQTFLGESVDDVLDGVFKALLQAMVRRYATDLNNAISREERVRISGMTDPVQYAEVLRYLRGLSVVESVRLVQASGTELEFSLVLRGEGLMDVLAVGQVLDVVTTEADGSIELRLK